MKTYKEIVENSRKAISELKGPDGNTTYEGNPMVEELIIYQELVAEACEKQIAKKPKCGTRKIIAGLDGAKCEICRSLIFDPHKYCHECGTKIDWGNE